ncbi:MAG: hypothetical protein AAF847_18690 [Bacteroidota bacterium]
MKRASKSKHSSSTKSDVPTQIIHFETSGSIIESTGNIAVLNDPMLNTRNLFHYFPIVESILPTFVDDAKERVIQLPKVEKFWRFNVHRIYDLSIKSIWREKTFLLSCEIKDLTARYEKLIATQQRRNESVIKNQICP